MHNQFINITNGKSDYNELERKTGNPDGRQTPSGGYPTVYLRLDCGVLKIKILK